VKTALRVLVSLAIALGALTAHAQRPFNQAELDALLAPIALYPDPLITHVLNASVFPQDVAAAAAWSRANPQLQGDAALRTVDSTPWNPSVKALVAYPDILARMVESPQWLADLGEAYAGAPEYVNATIQQLRARAQANGYLQNTDQQRVYQQGDDIVVQPVYPQVVYVPYYNPYLVYGTWWWPAYRPVYWRPWVPRRPVIVTRVVQPVRIVQPVRVVRQPVHFVRPTAVQVTPYHAVPESRRMPIIQSAPVVTRPVTVAPQMHQGGFRGVQEARRAAFAQSAPVARSMPAPQARATERPVRAFQAQGNRGGGGGRGNGHHRS
jgi:hypothetical protein